MKNSQKTINEKYKEILLKFINSPNVPNDDYDEYVNLLSLFISKGNPNYKYNYTYLNDMHKELCHFLKVVRDKQNMLKSISVTVWEVFEELGLDHTNISISIDKFFEINNREIKIVDNYSISDAKRDIENSKITILDKSKNNKSNGITLDASDINIDKIGNLITLVFEK